MNYITSILLVATIIYVWQSNKSTNQKINALLHGHTALFWALKNKNLIDMKDWKEGNKVARGDKSGNMTLKDFMDLQKE